MTSGHGVCVGHILIIRFNAFLGDAHAPDRLAGGGIAHQIEGRVSGEGYGRIGTAIISVLIKNERHLSNKAHLSGSDLEQNHYFTSILVQETKYKLTDNNSFY